LTIGISRDKEAPRLTTFLYRMLNDEQSTISVERFADLFGDPKDYIGKVEPLTWLTLDIEVSDREGNDYRCHGEHFVELPEHKLVWVGCDEGEFNPDIEPQLINATVTCDFGPDQMNVAAAQIILHDNGVEGDIASVRVEQTFSYGIDYSFTQLPEGDAVKYASSFVIYTTEGEVIEVNTREDVVLGKENEMPDIYTATYEGKVEGDLPVAYSEETALQLSKSLQFNPVCGTGFNKSIKSSD